MSLIAHRIVVDGLVVSTAAGVLIMTSLWVNPRLWLQDLPRDIRDAVPPKTRRERAQSLAWGLPFLVVLLGGPMWSSVLLERGLGGQASFATLWLDAFGVGMVFNIVDLLVIDWVIVCAITPRFLIVPGTAGFAGYKDYGHHARGFVVGVGVLAVVAIIAAGAAKVL